LTESTQKSFWHTMSRRGNNFFQTESMLARDAVIIM
jgi:hypothetical protein